MILSRRANDDDHRDGFTKWPFMTTHSWGEYPQGTWKLEVSSPHTHTQLGSIELTLSFSLYLCRQARFNSPQTRLGHLVEWSLVLHGTKEAPYRTLSPSSPHSKLAIVKKAHEDKKMK